MRALALAALALLAPVASALAEETLPGSAAELATAWSTQRKIAFGSANETFVVLLAEGGEASRLSVLSRQDGAWRELAPLPTSNATLRGTIAWADGALWAAWTEYLPAEGHHQVFAARFAGGAWRDAARLSHTRGYSGFPSLAAAPDGTLHAAWYGLDAGFYQVFHRARDPGSGAWSAPVRLSVGTPDAVNPSLAVDSEGAVSVAWYKQEGPTYQAFFARRSAAGEWGSPRILTSGPEHAKNAAVVVDREDRAWVAWDERDAAGDRRVWIARERGAGFSLQQPVSDPRENASYPALSLDERGAIVVAWAVEDAPIALARLDRNGTVVDRAEVGDAGARDPSLSPPRPGEAPLLLATLPSGDAWRAIFAEVDFEAGAEEARIPTPLAVLALALALALLLKRRRSA